MRIRLTWFAAVLGGLFSLFISNNASAVTVFSATGVDVAGILPTVDAFRSALGNLNPNVVGSFGTGRREINWDGVPDAFCRPKCAAG